MPRHTPAARRAAPRVLSFRPESGELDDRRRRQPHVVHATPLALRVVEVPAREEVRRRQALLGQPGAVRAAPYQCPLRLQADAADRLERTVDDLGSLVELVAHVAVLDLLGVLDSRARLARRYIAEDLAKQRDVLLEERVVVVPQDDAQLADRGVACDLVDVDE